MYLTALAQILSQLTFVVADFPVVSGAELLHFISALVLLVGARAGLSRIGAHAVCCSS